MHLKLIKQQMSHREINLKDKFPVTKQINAGDRQTAVSYTYDNKF